MNNTPSTNKILDNRGNNCTTGFVKLLEIMEVLTPGESLEILSTDVASQQELADWATRAGHTILRKEKTGPFWRREYHYLIQKGQPNSI